MGLPVDTMKVRLKDKNDPCISWSDIRDAVGKANGDRHLALFAFVVYRLIVFPKALGYVSYIDIPRNRMEGSMDDLEHDTHRGGSFSSGPRILEEIGRDTNQVGSNLELTIKNLFQPSPFGNVYPVMPKKKQNLCKQE
ncbi:hypothetical protein Gogos_021524 [Gossypium gossypioides]|uniref:Uncharacterized protein n=1 Tax=Gossypium gossypioides TaxID=34282 RepID=A0A7J9D5U5_GOSGO|nr:hypothetical protein [Gossypium gossypioides]